MFLHLFCFFLPLVLIYFYGFLFITSVYSTSYSSFLFFLSSLSLSLSLIHSFIHSFIHSPTKQKAIPQRERRYPLRLTLTSSHLAGMGLSPAAVCFTPAVFNEGEREKESAIVTATGRFLVWWNFVKAKKGDTTACQVCSVSGGRRRFFF